MADCFDFRGAQYIYTLWQRKRNGKDKTADYFMMIVFFSFRLIFGFQTHPLNPTPTKYTNPNIFLSIGKKSECEVQNVNGMNEMFCETSFNHVFGFIRKVP